MRKFRATRSSVIRNFDELFPKQPQLIRRQLEVRSERCAQLDDVLSGICRLAECNEHCSLFIVAVLTPLAAVRLFKARRGRGRGVGGGR